MRGWCRDQWSWLLFCCNEQFINWKQVSKSIWLFEVWLLKKCLWMVKELLYKCKIWYMQKAKWRWSEYRPIVFYVESLMLQLYQSLLLSFKTHKLTWWHAEHILRVDFQSNINFRSCMFICMCTFLITPLYFLTGGYMASN